MICLKCAADTLHQDLSTYSFDNSALWIFRTEADSVLRRVPTSWGWTHSWWHNNRAWQIVRSLHV